MILFYNTKYIINIKLVNIKKFNHKLKNIILNKICSITHSGNTSNFYYRTKKSHTKIEHSSIISLYNMGSLKYNAFQKYLIV